ncbi:hypothetical protein O181_093367 [Austropuccinia psidii MF-1]|uniref:Reverse transcriptase domain-containing protein n=1 Tax=Austropuccinia psidii MF-1 TaxID=1389203 RepID=A0A9Q3J1C0_9BASI|nr:hypothetical protein [Austropuccinia psidii MF-1]
MPKPPHNCQCNRDQSHELERGKHTKVINSNNNSLQQPGESKKGNASAPNNQNQKRVSPPPTKVQTKSLGAQEQDHTPKRQQQQSDIQYQNKSLTSLIETLASYHDIPNQKPPRLPPEFPPVTNDEVLGTISTLPNKKAPGPDGIPNELIKIAEPLLTPHLTHLFNSCLRQGGFPTQWKGSNTAIIRKAAKDDYTNPNAYRPIALLNTLGKLFEKIINTQLNHWAHCSKTIHLGHIGGRPSRSINNAFVMLTSWLHHKWREGKTVMGMFLDNRSAYPLVQKKRLIHILEQKQCPPYLCYIIDSCILGRTTRLKIDQFTSQDFQIPNGLPQGSPLSITLYLIYNYSLLLPSPRSLNKNNISLAYINDVVHLLATNTTQQGQAKKKADHKRNNNSGDNICPPERSKMVRSNPHSHTGANAPYANGQNQSQSNTQPIGKNHLSDLLTMPKRGKNAGSCNPDNETLTWEHHLEFRLCTGIMKQTPSPFLKLYDGIKDLTKQHIKLTHNYIHSKLTAPVDDEYQTLIWREITSIQSTHLSPLNNLLGRNTLLEQHSARAETLSSFQIPPWSTKLTNVINLGLTKESAKGKFLEQMKTELADHILIFFTDDSLIPGKGCQGDSMI